MYATTLLPKRTKDARGPFLLCRLKRCIIFPIGHLAAMGILIVDKKVRDKNDNKPEFGLTY